MTTIAPSAPSTAPVLSTPESHIFEDPTPIPLTSAPHHTDAAIWEIYEIERTVREIRDGGYKRVALQFPDMMLGDAVRVFEMLEVESGKAGRQQIQAAEGLETSFDGLAVSAANGAVVYTNGNATNGADERRTRFYVLADTSYGSCCVDEIAAEHVAADVVVHYGRSCLSPTARLPVLYVYTSHPLDIPAILESFTNIFPSREEKVVLMADITYHSHIPTLHQTLLEQGYTNIQAPPIIRDPESVVPNRSIAEPVRDVLGEYTLFHISEPPKALLLTLSSRVKDMYIYPTTSSSAQTPLALKTNTSALLRRRYALVTHLSSAPIIGILINTLSVSHHLAALSTLKSLIAAAGKKSYTFVVGKVNPAKLANFSEIGGWVVVGCWESSLVEGEGFYKGCVTPFELGVALQGERRVWDGSWRGDFGGLDADAAAVTAAAGKVDEQDEKDGIGEEDDDSEEESQPPVFDFRTGRYISTSRPMRSSKTSSPTTNSTQTTASNVLTRRAKGDLATINGAVSPGAEFLRSQRTWTGLGSDFAEGDAPEGIEEGRGGIARGYRVGEEGERR